MAKVAFSKLQASVNTSEVQTSYSNKAGEAIIFDVKQYLPFMDKVLLVERIINQSVDSNGFYNPMRVKMFMTLEVVYTYTNLSFTDKMKEDPFKLYDILTSSGIYKNIVECINKDEWDELCESVYDTIKNIYDYRNSVMGVLDAVSTDYEGLNLDAQAIKEQLSDANNLKLLKDVVTRLG
jgi:hypothetical protein